MNFLNTLETECNQSNSNTIYVGGKPQSISFSGCGFLGVYHIGVACCLQQHAPNLVQNFKRIYGCSAGSIMGAMLLGGVSFADVCHRTMQIVIDARSRYLGPLSPGFKLNETLIRDIRGGLPIDAHIRATGRLFISLTRLKDGKNVIVSDYKTREELIQVLICSCFVPFYSGMFPPKYRGIRYVDGGLSNNQPADHDTITVSPWSGNCDICPRNDGQESLVDLSFVNTSIQMTSSNIYRVSTMFFPPNPPVLKDFCSQAYRETAQYLRENGLFETVHPLRKNMSFSGDLNNVKERRRMTRKMSFTARYLSANDELAETDGEKIRRNSTSSSMTSLSSESDVISLTNSIAELEECFDENGNDVAAVATTTDNDEVTSSKVFTVVHVYPVDEDHSLRVQFHLPDPILQALEMTFHDNESVSKTRWSKLLTACKHSFVVRIPLNRSYTAACFILRHSTAVPHDLSWLVAEVRTLVEQVQEYFKCSGERLTEKLRNLTETALNDLQYIAEQMALAVQVITKALAQRNLTPALYRFITGEVPNSNCSFVENQRYLLEVV